MCFFLRCKVWDEVVEQKGSLPPSKSSIGSKKSPPKKNEKIVVHVFFILFCVFIYFLKIKILPIFSILGYLNAFCCLFVAKLPLTFAKLNSIPLNRARGPLNEISMLLRLIELNFNDSIRGRMHSECILCILGMHSECILC